MNNAAMLIKTKREQAGLTVEKLSNLAGCSKAMLSHFENGRPLDKSNVRMVLSIAKILGIEIEDLIDISDVAALIKGKNPPARLIPVLNYVQAGAPGIFFDDYVQGDGMAVIPVQGELADSLSAEGFALEVRGTSMLPDYREGDQVIIDPTITSLPGEVVVAKLDNEESATLKKYKPKQDNEHGPVFELIPLNEDHPVRLVDHNNPGCLIGPVVRHIRDPRKK